jgi:hypothetical protein
MTNKQLREARLRAAFTMVHGPFAWRQYQVASQRLAAAMESAVAEGAKTFANNQAICEQLVDLMKRGQPDPFDPVQGQITTVMLENFCEEARELLNGPRPPAVAQQVDPRDGDDWEVAVARDGVRPPSYGEGFLLTTSWELTCEACHTGRCAACDRTDVRTELHHLTYERFGFERPGDLLELCDDCHEQFHQTWKRAA